MSAPSPSEPAGCNCGRVHMRPVHLPLKDLSTGCAVCEANKGASGGRQRLCSSCGERIYCSEQCQIKDRPQHKLQCGTTHRINLESFYPMFAVIVDFTRCASLPPHFAIKCQIVSDPNPSLVPSQLPSGLEAKVLEVDDVEECWTLDPLRSALLGVMYTTTSGRGRGGVRTRLQYRALPIADFGIVAGSVKVHPSDRLAFRRRSTGVYVRGQDPERHFWLYFTPVRGAEVLLDMSVFTFNLCTVVESASYAPPAIVELAEYAAETVPAYFVERALRTGAGDIHIERHRVSALRDERLHHAVRYLQRGLDDVDVGLIAAFMADVARRRTTEDEIEIASDFTMQYCSLLHSVLKDELWRNYPEEPPLIQTDPDESLSDPNGLPNRKHKRKKKKTAQSPTQSSPYSVEGLMSEPERA